MSLPGARLSGTLVATYPRDGFFYGHLNWHLALGELEADNAAEAFRLFREGFSLDRHSGGPQQKMSDATAFLWRAELAGHPRDAAAWRAMHDYAGSALPRPGNGLADLHVILAQAVSADDGGLGARASGQMAELAGEGRYPSGPYLPALSRGFVAFEGRETSPRRSTRSNTSPAKVSKSAAVVRSMTRRRSRCSRPISTPVARTMHGAC